MSGCRCFATIRLQDTERDKMFRFFADSPSGPGSGADKRGAQRFLPCECELSCHCQPVESACSRALSAGGDVATPARLLRVFCRVRAFRSAQSHGFCNHSVRARSRNKSPLHICSVLCLALLRELTRESDDRRDNNSIHPILRQRFIYAALGLRVCIVSPKFSADKRGNRGRHIETN